MSISRRDQVILQMHAEGSTNDAIAERFCISVETVAKIIRKYNPVPIDKNKKHPTYERNLKILKMREEGKTYREISASFSICQHRARQIVEKIKRDQSREKGKARNALYDRLNVCLFASYGTHDPDIEEWFFSKFDPETKNALFSLGYDTIYKFYRQCKNDVDGFKTPPIIGPTKFREILRVAKQAKMLSI